MRVEGGIEKAVSAIGTWQSSGDYMLVVGVVRGTEVHSKVGIDVGIPTKLDYQESQVMIYQAIAGSLHYLPYIILPMALRLSSKMAGQVGIRYYSDRKTQHHLHCQN